MRLLRRDELPDEWNPMEDAKLVKWEVVQHLIKALEKGTDAAARLYKKLGADAEAGRELAYRLFTISEKKGYIEEAIAYNSLVLEWSAIVGESYKIPNEVKVVQQSIFDTV